MSISRNVKTALNISNAVCVVLLTELIQYNF